MAVGGTRRTPGFALARKKCCIPNEGCLPNEGGQMAVEFMVVLPVLLVVALIAVNALSFFSECAAFDNQFRQAVCTHAVAPAYGQDATGGVALVQASLNGAYTRDNQSVEVVCAQVAGGITKFTGTLTWHPTLFGMGLRSQVFGVNLPALKHSATLSVSCYKPGVLL